MALDQQLVAIAGQTGIRVLGPNCQGIINNQGLYQKARPGEIKGFADIDDPYEASGEPRTGDRHVQSFASGGGVFTKRFDVADSPACHALTRYRKP